MHLKIGADLFSGASLHSFASHLKQDVSDFNATPNLRFTFLILQLNKFVNLAQCKVLINLNFQTISLTGILKLYLILTYPIIWLGRFNHVVSSVILKNLSLRSSHIWLNAEDLPHCKILKESYLLSRGAHNAHPEMDRTVHNWEQELVEKKTW